LARVEAEDEPFVSTRSPAVAEGEYSSVLVTVSDGIPGGRDEDADAAMDTSELVW
jgi:hypothetical protein